VPWRAYYLRVIAETTLGALAALGAAMAWAATSLLVRSLVHELGSVAVNAVRSTIGGAILLVWVLGTAGAGALTAPSTRALVLLALSIVAAIAIGDTVFFESTRALGLGRAMTISMTYPVGAAALAAAFLGEPVTLAVALGTLLTLAGLVLIVAPWAERAPHERFAFGVGTATLASLAWAVSVVLVKPPLREMDAVTAQAIRLPLAALVLWATPWARAAAGGLGRLGGAALARLAALSVLTVLSSVLFVASVKYAGVAAAAVLSSTAPMFAIPLARVFFGERLSRPALLGAGVTLAGIVVLQL
jgi:DME family drug/metabolite transporter